MSRPQAVVPPLLCAVAAAAEAHAARRGAADGAFEHSVSEPYLGHLDGSLRATYALVWAAGKPRACMQVRSHAAATLNPKS